MADLTLRRMNVYATSPHTFNSNAKPSDTRLRMLLCSTHGTRGGARRRGLPLVVSRRAITATKVIIKARVLHTCYHCSDARFWLNIRALIGPIVGVPALLSARLSRKDGPGPPETPGSGPHLSMTRHNECRGL